jgi:dUTP pyrophosphatase
MKMQVALSRNILAPMRATTFSAGVDLRAPVSGYIGAGRRKLIMTGVRAKIPAGHVGLVCSRSGLALKEGVVVLNAPGIIDEDYRGEIGVILFNSTGGIWQYDVGERIAQLLVSPVAYPTIEIVTDLDDTERGAGGFGSTGA